MESLFLIAATLFKAFGIGAVPVQAKSLPRGGN